MQNGCKISQSRILRPFNPMIYGRPSVLITMKVDKFVRVSRREDGRYHEADVVQAALDFANLKGHQLRRNALGIQHRTVKEVWQAHRWVRKALESFATQGKAPNFLPQVWLKEKPLGNRLDLWLGDVRLVPYREKGILRADGELLVRSIGGACAYAAVLISERRGRRKAVPLYRIGKCGLTECSKYFRPEKKRGRYREYCCDEHKDENNGK